MAIAQPAVDGEQHGLGGAGRRWRYRDGHARRLAATPVSAAANRGVPGRCRRPACRVPVSGWWYRHHAGLDVDGQRVCSANWIPRRRPSRLTAAARRSLPARNPRAGSARRLLFRSGGRPAGCYPGCQRQAEVERERGRTLAIQYLARNWPKRSRSASSPRMAGMSPSGLPRRPGCGSG